MSIFKPDLNAQGLNYTWWNDIHHWDGISSWQSYMTYSAENFGPNALPCPEVKEGAIEKHLSIKLDFESHFTEGEETLNLLTRLFIPVVAERVGLELRMVPVELYQMDTVVRDNRASRDYDGKGVSVGDLYVSTWITLLKERNKRPNLLLSINLKTASGNNLEGVRFMDTPGYYFDLSIGKTLLDKAGVVDSCYLYAMAGIYVWQIIDERYMQDDAFLYGAGITTTMNSLSLSGEFAGYYGYIGDGDRPLVARISAEYSFNRAIRTNIRAEQGITDFPFFSLSAGLIWNFK